LGQYICLQWVESHVVMLSVTHYMIYVNYTIVRRSEAPDFQPHVTKGPVSCQDVNYKLVLLVNV
jgi:hypothetical protein